MLKCLKIHGFRLKKEKCKFMLPSTEYLGHQINLEGMRPLEDKVEAIAKNPTPSNLRSFLGLLNYYEKFIPNLATISHPLTTLLSTGKKWDWKVECVKAFELAKSQLMSAQVLTHYDPPITLAAMMHQWCHYFPYIARWE